MVCGTILMGSACSATTEKGKPPVPADTLPGRCKNDTLQNFIGQKATAAIGAEMLKASGARTLRWGAPNMAMTMDFRPDRLTVSYDADMTILTAHCG